MARRKQGRKSETSFLIVDAKSIKGTDLAEERGYDAGKKVSGIKLHALVDTQGLVHAVSVTPANVTDRAGALELLERHKTRLSGVINILADGGYTGKKFADEVLQKIGSTVEIAKRSELHKFVVMPQRWVVERTFGWLEKCRRLWKNCERKLESSLGMTELAFLVLLVRRF